MAVQVALDVCSSIRDGRLFVEECDAHTLARRFETPVTVVTGHQAEWIKRSETVADVFARDLIPDRPRRVTLPR